MSDPTYVPYPVHGIWLSAENRFAALEVDEEKRNPAGMWDSRSYTTYLLDLQTGEHRKIGDGDTSLHRSPSSHLFASSDDSDSITIFNGLAVNKQLKTGKRGGVWWNTDRSILFESGWPEDSEGTSELGILNVDSGAVRHMKLLHVVDAISTCPASRHLFTKVMEENARGVDEYDADGNYVGHRDNDLAFFSASCKYALPLTVISSHGPESWSVHDSDGKLLIDVLWSEDGRSPLRLFDSWNPKYDHLLLMSSALPDKDGTIDALDVRTNKVIRQWRNAPSEPPKVWSGDGKSVVTVRDHHVVFDKVIGE